MQESENIFFCLEGVLLHVKPFFVQSFQTVAKEYELNCQSRELDFSRSASEWLDRILLQNGRVFSPSEREDFLSHQELLYEELLSTVSRSDIPFSVWKMLKKKKENGDKIGLILRNEKEVYFAKKAELLPFFDVTIFPQDEQTPFENLLKNETLFSIGYENCLLVSNVIEELEIASSLGMKAVLFSKQKNYVFSGKQIDSLRSLETDSTEKEKIST